MSAALVYGGAFHAACEHHYRELLDGRPAPALDALMAAYNDAWAEHDGKVVQFGKDDDRGTLDDLAGHMLAAFQASEIANPPGTIIGIEEELTGELVSGVPDLLARVDLLGDAGDSLVLTDLKTARSCWSAGTGSRIRRATAAQPPISRAACRWPPDPLAVCRGDEIEEPGCPPISGGRRSAAD